MQRKISSRLFALLPVAALLLPLAGVAMPAAAANSSMTASHRYLVGSGAGSACLESPGSTGACFAVPSGSQVVGIRIADATALPVAAWAYFDDGQQDLTARAVLLCGSLGSLAVPPRAVALKVEIQDGVGPQPCSPQPGLGTTGLITVDWSV